jgi:hypothetical protein
MIITIYISSEVDNAAVRTTRAWQSHICADASPAIVNTRLFRSHRGITTAETEETGIHEDCDGFRRLEITSRLSNPLITKETSVIRRS